MHTSSPPLPAILPSAAIAAMKPPLPLPTPATIILAADGTSLLQDGRAEGCHLLGDHFGFLVQGLLFCFCACSLLLKWWLEETRRAFKIFLLDSSKQIFGAGVIHLLNMVCAVVFSHAPSAAADQCAWYWVNIMIDTTAGVVFCWALLKLTEKAFGYDSGHYGKGAQTGIDWESSPNYRKWGNQILAWGFIVCVMKLIVVGVMWAWAPLWENLAIRCTHWIHDRQLRLVFVMVITPTCMNMFQFWVTDTFLRYRKLQKRDSLALPRDSSPDLKSM